MNFSPEKSEMIQSYLTRMIPSFEESEEYLEWTDGGDSDDSLLLVGGALTAYLVRLQGSTLFRRRRTSVKAVISEIYNAIEVLAGSPDLDLQNFVQVNVFENLHCSKRLLKRIVNGLLPRSRDIFDKFNL